MEINNRELTYLKNEDLFDQEYIKEIINNNIELGTSSYPNTVGVGYSEKSGYYSYITNKKGCINKEINFFNSFEEALQDARKRYLNFSNKIKKNYDVIFYQKGLDIYYKNEGISHTITHYSMKELKNRLVPPYKIKFIGISLSDVKKIIASLIDPNIDIDLVEIKSTKKKEKQIIAEFSIKELKDIEKYYHKEVNTNQSEFKTSNNLYLMNNDLYNKEYIKELIKNNNITLLTVSNNYDSVGIAYKNESGYYVYMTDERGNEIANNYNYLSFKKALKKARRLYHDLVYVNAKMNEENDYLERIKKQS